MSLFQFSQPEILTFFAVLVRYSVLVAVLPFFGDKVVPLQVKILFSLALTLVLFPPLVHTGKILPENAATWGATTGGMIGVIAMETIVGLSLGFVGRLAFDAINFGGHLVGTFMGLSAAAFFDPHTEVNTQVISELQMALAMLLFLAVDGHHIMLTAGLESYRIVPLGGTGVVFGNLWSQRLIEISSQVIRFGIQLAAPVAICIFVVNVAFGVMAKAMPQLNVLVLSFSVTALVGFAVLLLSLPEFTGLSEEILSRMGDWMAGDLGALMGRPGVGG